ncbi:hypothetical protein PP740_gp037 [Stenotrophomonas phage Philippe]|uniref:Uncharacterized protein n=1 Tax=Stenotrophomonas phage Philippe TaxID=2859655 RepID=A0AAE7WMJ2_9CAUD|nr:hypothetical protein PP740_gp037 [Stenotrophomonas phage Philippe]QYW02236.1 hypothetical protein CPT_Philippe_037 [Stenotrophomonas phage Philippe]
MSDRTPQTDALDTLGLIHFRPEKRDAIHLAVEAVEATACFEPGDHIGIIEGKAYIAGSAFPRDQVKLETYPKTVPYHGIVDPFLHRGPNAGERFWFVMKPREVRSLRHVWEHPDFPEGE